MLEIQNGLTSLPISVGPTTLKAITTTGLARANMGSSFNAGKFLVSGGFAQPANPYPNNATLVTLNEARDAVVTTTNPAGYDGTSTHGSAVGGRLWIAMGHDGAYRGYLKSRNADTGAIVGGNSAACPGPTRINASIYAEGADNIIYGLGYNPNDGWLKDLWRYTPSTNSWTALKSLGPESLVMWFAENVKGPDGWIYMSADPVALCIHKYHPGTNTWAKTSSFARWVDPGMFRPFAEAALAVAGKYILFIQAGQQNNIRNTLVCYRYNTLTDSWDAKTLPGRTALYSPRAAVEESKNKLYLFGGAMASENIQAYPASSKSASLFTFNLSDFTKD